MKPLLIILCWLIGVVLCNGCALRGHRHRNVQPLGELHEPITARGNERYYEVLVGDSLLEVAKKFNTSKEYLIKRNEITKAQDFAPGKVIIVPIK